jgi:hypothetical protein
MASLPKVKIPAYGSSRSTGGVIIRGKPHGNTINMGDADAVWEDMNVFSDSLLRNQSQVLGSVLLSEARMRYS